MPQGVSGVRVHIEGADDAEVQQRTERRDEWQTVCSGPCDVELPVGPDYRIAGGGMRPSGIFHLTGGPGNRVVVTVSPASKAWFVMGIVVVSIGGPVALVGLALGLVGSLGTSTTTPGSIDHQNWASVERAGWITFAVGAAAIVGGVVLIVNNSRSSTTLENAAAAQTGLLVEGDAWKRVPTWHDAKPEEKAAPQIMAVPLWTGRF